MTNERRRELERDAAQRAGEHPVAPGLQHGGRGRARARGKQVGIELDGAGQTGAADVGDSVQVAERLEQLPEHGLELDHAVDERLSLEDVEVREGRRCTPLEWPA